MSKQNNPESVIREIRMLEESVSRSLFGEITETESEGKSNLLKRNKKVGGGGGN